MTFIGAFGYLSFCWFMSHKYQPSFAWFSKKFTVLKIAVISAASYVLLVNQVMFDSFWCSLIWLFLGSLLPWLSPCVLWCSCFPFWLRVVCPQRTKEWDISYAVWRSCGTLQGIWCHHEWTHFFFLRNGLAITRGCPLFFITFSCFFFFFPFGFSPCIERQEAKQMLPCRTRSQKQISFLYKLPRSRCLLQQ